MGKDTKIVLGDAFIGGGAFIGEFTVFIGLYSNI